VDDFLHACCSASIDDYDRVHNAIQSALDDRLKTAAPEVFIGADYFALAGTSQDGENGAALHRSSNGIHVSVSAQIIALCDRLLPHDLPPSKTDTRVPMSESVYRRLAHKEGAPIAHDHPDAAWLRSVSFARGACQTIKVAFCYCSLLSSCPRKFWYFFPTFFKIKQNALTPPPQTRPVHQPKPHFCGSM
jgi:hypothetical protein